MRAVKGLVIKDLLQLRDFRYPLLFWTVVLAGASSAWDKLQFLPLLMAFGFGMVVLFSFTFDETSGAERYIACLPVSRREIVLSKYVLALASSAVGSVAGVLLGLALQWFKHGTITHIDRWLGLILVGVFLMAVMNALQIPCIYKGGATRGRILVFVLLAGAVLVGWGLQYLASALGLDLMKSLEAMFNRHWFLMFLVLTALLYGVSFRIACRIYGRKDI